MDGVRHQMEDGGVNIQVISHSTWALVGSVWVPGEFSGGEVGCGVEDGQDGSQSTIQGAVRCIDYRSIGCPHGRY